MWDYTDTVKEHFFNPRNVGAMDDANAVGDVGSIQCGDALRLALKVDDSNETILEAKFQTFGCGSAIASSSALTEMVKGKTLDEALKISNQEIADYLGGLPPEKMHCSVMGKEALEAAIANYRGEEWHENEEGDLGGKCFGIHSDQIESAIKENGLSTLEEVTNYTKAGGGCSCCHEAIEEILVEVAAPSLEKPAVKTPEPNKSNVSVPNLSVDGKPRMTNIERIRIIEKVIAEIQPQIRADGGDLQLVDVDKRIIYVSLSGACSGCMGAGYTLEGIQQKLCESLGELIIVVPAGEGNA